ncbi:MAG: hypothetical protein H3C52_01090 [Anaerolineales bacterium]|nr:hypothetical protein [Anaerolineales bacterium]
MFKMQMFFPVLILLLSACAPTSQAAPTPTLLPPATEAPTQARTVDEPPALPAAPGDGCPAATMDTKLMVSAENGICLLYPAEFAWDGATLIVLNPTGMAGDAPGDAWLLTSISEAGGQTAAQIADAQIAEIGAGPEIVRTELTIGGKPAVLVDGMPAQDSARYLYVVNNDRLYRFEFMPWYPENGATPLEKLYQTLVDTLHFLP